MTIVDVIKESQVFQNLSTEQLQKVASISREETYAAGQYIFREGDQARSLFVIEEGKVILEMKITSPAERPVSLRATIDGLIKGDVLGWSAVVEPHILTLSAHALDSCKVIAIDSSKLLELMDSDPLMGHEAMKQLSKVISSRLTHTRQMLISERGLALLSEVYRY